MTAVVSINRTDDRATDTVRELLSAATLTEASLRTVYEIERLRSLPPGWDGYDAFAPSDNARAQAKSFVASLPADMQSPEIEPSGHGEINLVWRNEAAYLEIGFTGGPTFSFFGKTLAGPALREFGDIDANANRLPIALIAFMGRFVNADVRVREESPERASFAWAS